VRLATDVDVGVLMGLRAASAEEGEDDDASDWGYIANAFVLREHRDNGLGTALLEAALAYADEHELVRVVLSPSVRSVPFYARAGFVVPTNLMVRTKHLSK
jgi:GNAT superfamily N-acetyltransferase